jgi:hypothetical protein
MAAYDFVARKGSTSRSLYFTIDSSNPADDFSTVTAVHFFMRKSGSAVTTNKIDGVAVASFTIAGDNKSVTCRYDWQAQDVDEDGTFEGYARTTSSGSKTDRFPADDTGKFISIKFLKSFE